MIMGDPVEIEVPVVFGGIDNCLYKCPFSKCAYTTELATNVKSHLRYRHKSDSAGKRVHFLYKCARCFMPVRTINTDSIAVHWQNCRVTTNWEVNANCHPCTRCDRKFMHVQALEKHTKNVHSATSSSDRVISIVYNGPNTDTKLACPICIPKRGSKKPHIYSTVTKLRSHMRDRHHEDLVLSVTCGLCGIKLPQSSTLRHASNHYKQTCRKMSGLPFSKVSDESFTQLTSSHTADTPTASRVHSPAEGVSQTTTTPRPDSHRDPAEDLESFSAGLRSFLNSHQQSPTQQVSTSKPTKSPNQTTDSIITINSSASTLPVDDNSPPKLTPQPNSSQTPTKTPRKIHFKTPCNEFPFQTAFQTPYKTPSQTLYKTPLQTPSQTPYKTPSQTPSQTPYKTPFQPPSQTPYKTPFQTPRHFRTQPCSPPLSDPLPSNKNAVPNDNIINFNASASAVDDKSPQIRDHKSRTWKNSKLFPRKFNSPSFQSPILKSHSRNTTPSSQPKPPKYTLTPPPLPKFRKNTSLSQPTPCKNNSPPKTPHTPINTHHAVNLNFEPPDNSSTPNINETHLPSTLMVDATTQTHPLITGIDSTPKINPTKSYTFLPSTRNIPSRNPTPKVNPPRTPTAGVMTSSKEVPDLNPQAMPFVPPAYLPNEPNPLAMPPDPLPHDLNPEATPFVLPNTPPDVETPPNNTNTRQVRKSPRLPNKPSRQEMEFASRDLVCARESLINLIEDQGPDSSFDQLERGFTEWCECATRSFSPKDRPRGHNNAGAKARSQRNRKEPKGVGQKRTRYRKNVAMRKAFAKDPKGTMRKILNGDESGARCPIPAKTLGDWYRETYRLPADQRKRLGLPEWMSNPNIPGPDSADSSLDYPISPAEVEAAINTRDLSSAPGTDGLSYKFWKALDPQGERLARLFELCRVKRRIFTSWRSSRITLICKDAKGDRHNVSNWRPIAVCAAVYRIYAAVLARRISDWARESNVISPSQKGFMPAEGVFEHLFMLDQVIEDARAGRRALCVTWLDIRNAFGSVKPDCILQVLEHCHAPLYMREVVADLYKAGSFTLRGGDGRSVEVETQKGVRQGCPLSGILFNLVVEVLLRGVVGSGGTDGYTLGRDRKINIQALAYADDICLVSQSRQQMNHQLRRCEQFAAWAGFEFNTSKCASMRLCQRTNKTDTLPLKFGNGHIRVLNRGEFYKYLGANTGHRLPCTDSKFVQKVEDDVRTLFKTPLFPTQKLVALKRFIIPSLRFHLRVRPFTQRDLHRLDTTVLRCVRAAFRLPGNACNSFFYTPCQAGGLGIPSLAVEHDILTVTQVYKMMTSPDEQVSSTAIDHLEWVIARKHSIQRATREDITTYLSGANPSGSDTANCNSGAPRDIFSRVTRSSRRLKVQFKLEDDGSFSVEFRGNLVTSVGRRVLTKALHQNQHLVWLEKWQDSPSQGKSVASLSRYPVSNRFINQPKLLSPGATSFALKARLSLLPTLNVVQRFNRGPRPVPFSFLCCRGCGSAEENLGHVLNVCPSTMDLQLERHNRIQDLLVNSIPVNHFRSVRLDCVNDDHHELSGDVLRPDVVATRHDGSTVVVDVTVPYVNGPQSLQRAAERKLAKYEELATNIMQRSGKEVHLFPFVVGSLGCYSKYNRPAMDALGIPLRVQRGLAPQLVTTAINGSCKIWNRFIHRFHRNRLSSDETTPFPYDRGRRQQQPST